MSKSKIGSLNSLYSTDLRAITTEYTALIGASVVSSLMWFWTELQIASITQWECIAVTETTVDFFTSNYYNMSAVKAQPVFQDTSNLRSVVLSILSIEGKLQSCSS